jgi:RNA polymerase sigma factor (sigma-70 family)
MAIWTGCVRRIRAWQVPPHWCPRDWLEEALAQGAVAAWQALRDYDPERGVPLSAFVHQRILSSVWTRYRQEWAYALHTDPVADTNGCADPSDDSDMAFQEQNRLQSLLALLSESDRRLIEQLFLEGRTETELARELGISQQAVSKRKQKLLSRLRCSRESLNQKLKQFSCEKKRACIN